ncbi:MAG: MCE family protein [Ignavibacteriales bacterium]|nr:MCE family protein [Ignavibacteriales bacterium]
MKDTKKTNIKVGITLFVAIIVIILILIWAKNISFSAKKELSIRFNSVSGLEMGDPVMLNGVRKGYVSEIKVDRNNVIVKSVLDKDVVITDDALFSLMMLDLMGGKKIEINPGDGKEITDFSIIQNGEFVGDISTAMAMLSSVQYDLVDFIKEAKIALIAMNDLLGDEAFIKQLKNSISDLSLAMRKVNIIMDENRQDLNNMLSTGVELADNLNKLIINNKENIYATLENANVLLKNTNELVIKVEEFLVETKEQSNNIGKFLYDKQLYNDLKISLEKLKELSNILIEQLNAEGIRVDADVF